MGKPSRGDKRKGADPASTQPAAGGRGRRGLWWLAGGLVLLLAVWALWPRTAGPLAGLHLPGLRPPPPHSVGGWQAGPTKDIDGFHLAVLTPDKINFGAGPNVFAGTLDCTAPGYWGQRIKQEDPPEGSPLWILRLFTIQGDSLQAGPQTLLPDSYPDTPVLYYPDGRVISVTNTWGKDADLKQPGSIAHSYSLVKPTGMYIERQERYFYTSDKPVAGFPVRFPGLLQVLYREAKPASGPYPLDVWLCPPDTAGRSLTSLSTAANGDGWLGTQRINVIVDAQGQLLLPDPTGATLLPAPQWQAAGARIAQSSAQLRQVALADTFVMFDTANGVQLLAQDRSELLISSDLPADAKSAGDANAYATLAPEYCGTSCRMHALDSQTLLLLDANLNRITLVRYAGKAAKRP